MGCSCRIDFKKEGEIDMKRENRRKVYQSPKVFEIGTFNKSTLGGKFEDTADLKTYYH